MKRKKMYLFVSAMLVIMAALIIDICLQVKTLQLLEKGLPQCQPRKSLPCESVPLRWAVDNYGCANSLLFAMNVTNVKFNPPRQYTNST